MIRSRSQQGFTMIELMIALVLGLLIVAAVTQVYLVAVRTASTQKAAAGILDANVYGLQQIERSLRMAGLGLSEVSRLDSTCSGILLKKGTLTECSAVTGLDKSDMNNIKTIASPVATLPDNLWTRDNAGATPNTSSTGMPQLTIQYRAPVNMVDCEGKLALGPRQVVGSSASRQSAGSSTIDIDGQVIIERYFVSQGSNGLELRCDAGRYVPETITADASQPATAVILQNIASGRVQDMGDNGSLIIAGIDDFQLQLGVKVPEHRDKNNPNTVIAETIQYQTISEYLNSPPKPTTISDADAQKIGVVATKLAVLAKGQVAASANDLPAGSPSYQILGKAVTAPASTTLRRVYESSVMLRNSRGEN